MRPCQSFRLDHRLEQDARIELLVIVDTPNPSLDAFDVGRRGQLQNEQPAGDSREGRPLAGDDSGP
jgi:hypothetical protein